MIRLTDALIEADKKWQKYIDRWLRDNEFIVYGEDGRILRLHKGAYFVKWSDQSARIIAWQRIVVNVTSLFNEIFPPFDNSLFCEL